MTAIAKRHAGTAVFAVAFVVLGLPDFAHGVAWPDMRAVTSLTAHRGLGDFAASTWVSLYWIALTAGRLWLALTQATGCRCTGCSGSPSPALPSPP